MSQIRLTLRRILVTLVSALLVLTGLATLTAPAQAAVPNRWGFALVDIPSGIPDPNHQAGSWPAGFNVSVTPGVVGQTFVRFPQIASGGGVVHVTAVVNTAAWCQVEAWTPVGVDELVTVRCYRFGGVPGFVPFTVMYETSSGPLPAGTHGFGYVAYNGAAITASYNSVLGANTVVPTGVGVWTVTLNGLGAPAPAGNLQVTSVNPGAPARCKVGAWSPGAVAQTVQVRCHDGVNTPFNTGWNLTYQRERAITGGAIPPKNFAYTFDVNPANPGPYAPVPVGINYNSQAGVNTVQTAGVPGLRMVIFPRVGVLRDHVQATAFGSGPEYCNLQATWVTSGSQAFVRNVSCWNATTRVDRQSLVTYTSQF
ncbi:hypothetical protein Aph01nite_32980 [Acrocarpospora phusangensis]|uniref:CBM2 domain-containing protein n=1 Tax=Acrocarpospora phusangensis TaxID=1070424 RepID=A0A919QCN9_9ACTN|nr:hypothetical protein [Acrocarpospora phusangensis]GIH24988.1 hypothetical protein Aph01nite_32980 [Acrocarpospora phusangensis]